MNLCGIGTLWLDGREVKTALRYAIRIEQRGIMTRASGHVMTERHGAASIVERIDPPATSSSFSRTAAAGLVRSRARTAFSPAGARFGERAADLRLVCGPVTVMDSSELDGKIDELAATVKEPLFFGPRRDGEFWRGVWGQIRAISQAFRGVRYPAKAERQAAWERFSAIVEDVKRQRDEHYAQRKSKEDESQRLLAEIISKTQEGWPHEDGFIEFLGVVTGAAILAEAMVKVFEIMATILTFGLLTPDETDPRRAKLMACSAAMKEAWALYKSYRDDLLPHHRDAARKALTGVQGELDNEWAKYKADQQAHRDERGRRFAENREAKEELISEARALIGRHRDPDVRQRAKAIFQDWRALKSAGRDHDDRLWQSFRGALDDFWSESKEERRRHLREQIEKTEEKLEKARSNRDANEERLSGARNDDYADRVREWIEQDDSNIERLEGWLSDFQEQLDKLDD